MYNVIDHSYGQNLGFSDNDDDDGQTTGTLSIISQVLEGDRQLEDWLLRLLPPLGLHVYQKPLSREELDKTPATAEAVIHQRFNIVLSLRYHNLRILLHRKFLERFLDYFGVDSHASSSSVTSQERKILRQVGNGSIQKCVESAMAIISTMHTIALSPAKWHRSILGAWNYSLYYSMHALPWHIYTYTDPKKSIQRRPLHFRRPPNHHQRTIPSSSTSTTIPSRVPGYRYITDLANRRNLPSISAHGRRGTPASRPGEPGY